MRKNFIGKNVKVKIDEIKSFKNKEDKDIEITNASISLNN